MGWVIEVTLPLGNRPGIRCAGGWVHTRASVDGYGKSRPQRDSIPRLMYKVYHKTVSKKCPSDGFTDAREFHWHYFPQTAANRLV
jgi:hypothetical protein